MSSIRQFSTFKCRKYVSSCTFRCWKYVSIVRFSACKNVSKCKFYRTTFYVKYIRIIMRSRWTNTPPSRRILSQTATEVKKKEKQQAHTQWLFGQVRMWSWIFKCNPPAVIITEGQRVVNMFWFENMWEQALNQNFHWAAKMFHRLIQTVICSLRCVQEGSWARHWVLWQSLEQLLCLFWLFLFLHKHLEILKKILIFANILSAVCFVCLDVF